MSTFFSTLTGSLTPQPFSIIEPECYRGPTVMIIAIIENYEGDIQIFIYSHFYHKIFVLVYI